MVCDALRTQQKMGEGSSELELLNNFGGRGGTLRVVARPFFLIIPARLTSPTSWEASFFTAYFSWAPYKKKGTDNVRK